MTSIDVPCVSLSCCADNDISSSLSALHSGESVLTSLGFLFVRPRGVCIVQSDEELTKILCFQSNGGISPSFFVIIVFLLTECLRLGCACLRCQIIDYCVLHNMIVSPLVIINGIMTCLLLARLPDGSSSFCCTFTYVLLSMNRQKYVRLWK